MSGFSLDWLALREPADRAARAPDLLEAAATLVAGRERPLVADLGCGTGSTFRALAPHLPADARWRFVDADRALLDEAGRLAGHDVELMEVDLAAGDALPVADADIVTASALFDLVSHDWVRRLVAALSKGRASLYAALTYDGRIAFERPHPDDAAMVAAFDRHQRGDKGFGPALGPTAAGALTQVLEEADFSVRTADSPWRLSPGPLQAAFVDGVAGAVRETGDVPAARIEGWMRFRHGEEGAGLCTVGHVDILASRRVAAP